MEACSKAQIYDPCVVHGADAYSDWAAQGGLSEGLSVAFLEE